MERGKTIVLAVLVVLSFVQSYFLAYNMPGFRATVRTEQDYVNAEKMGPETNLESVIFPEKLILHMGQGKHTILYPGSEFYDLIFKDKIQGRAFKGFQRSSTHAVNWKEVRDQDMGIELRFGSGVPVALLQKVLKLEGDFLFENEVIDRIWIFKKTETEAVRTYFFSADGQVVYESVRADLTVRDVQDYVGFGEYLTLYEVSEDDLYVPLEPVSSVGMTVSYNKYSPEALQSNLFFDPSITKSVDARNGSQIYTDGKRGLLVEQQGSWVSYTDPAAPQSDDQYAISDNVVAAVEFVNQHGGWDGMYRFFMKGNETKDRQVAFRQYYEKYPIIEQPGFRYGSMELKLEQGAVTEYNRTMIELGDEIAPRVSRWLPGGYQLKQALSTYNKRLAVKDLFPAFLAKSTSNNRMVFTPVWAVRLKDGTEQMLQEAYPAGYRVEHSAVGEQSAASNADEKEADELE